MNGLKTIYARFADLQMGDTLDDGVDLGQVTGALAKAGINALDSNGNMRNVGDVMEDLMDVWGQMNQTQKNAIAVVLAGKYQLTRFEALMNRSDLYDQYKQSSETGREGDVLNVMNEKYVNSLEGRLNKLQASIEGVFNNLFNTDNFYDFLGGLSQMVDLFNQLTESVGGGATALTGFSAVATKAFSNQIGRGISNAVINRQGVDKEAANTAIREQILNQLGQTDTLDLTQQQKDLIEYAAKGASNQARMTAEETAQWNEALKNVVDNMVEINNLQQQISDKIQSNNRGMEVTGEAKENRKVKISDAYSEEDMRELENLRRNIIVDPADLTSQGIINSGVYKQTVKSLGSWSGDITDVIGMYESGVESFKGMSDVLERIQGEMAKFASESHNEGSAETINALKAEVENTSKALVDNSSAVEDNVAELDRLHQAIKVVQSDYVAVADNGILQNSKDVTALQNKMGEVKQRRNDVETGMSQLEALTNTYDTREVVTQIVNVAGAVGQLAFTWQSFQSLGSLWSDDSISLGDKLLETIMNLGMTLPMAVSGMMDMVAAYRTIKEATGAQNMAEVILTTSKTAEAKINEMLIAQEEKLATVRKASATASKSEAAANTAESLTEVATATKSVSKGGKEATTATQAFIGVLSALNTGARGAATALVALVRAAGPLALIATAVGAVSAAIGAYNERQAQIAEYNQQRAEDAKTRLDALSDKDSGVQSFQNLYQQYKAGEKSASELRSAADSLNDTLGDQQLKILAAAGAWDQFAGKLKEVSATKVDEYLNTLSAEAQSSQQAVFEAQNGDWFWSPNQQSFGGIQTSTYKGNVSAKINAQTSSLSNRWSLDGTDWEYQADTDTATRVKDIQTANKIYEDQIQELNNQLKSLEQGSEEYRELNNSIANLTAEQKGLQELQSQSADEVKDYNDKLSAIAEGWQFKAQDDSSLQYQGGSVEDYKNQIRGTSEYQGIESSLGHDAAESILDSYVEGMASADVTGSENLAQQWGKEQTELSFGQGLYSKIIDSNIFTDGQNADLENKIAESLAETTGQTKEMIDAQLANSSSEMYKSVADGLVASVIQQVNNANLTDEQKQSIMSNIDWSDSIQNILGSVAQAIKQGEAGQSTDVYDDLKDTEGRRSHLTNDYKVDEDQIEAFKELQKQEYGLGAQEEELQKQLQDTTKEFGAQSKEAKDAQKRLDTYNDSVDDLADMTIQSEKGLESLSDSIEENAKVLRSGDKSSLAYAEAMDETRQSVADLVNVSKEDISVNFVTDHLDDIEKAADGDEDAINRLRVAAAQDIVAQFTLKDSSADGGMTAEQKMDYLKSKAEELGNMSIEPYAYLDDTQFVDTLNQMLANGEMTAEQVTAYLNSIGYDPTIEMVEAKTNAVQIPATDIPFNIMGQELGGLHIPDVTVPITTSVPKITSIQKGGGVGAGAAKAKKSGGGGGKKGGGGSGRKGGNGGSGSGSGSGSSYDPKTKDPIEEEIDRYEKVQTKLDKVGNEFERINTEQDRLTGYKRLDNMEKQIGLLQKQIELQKEKLSIQKQEAEELRNTLSAQYGITFDDNGYIANYAAIHQQLTDQVNNLINQYNSTTSEEGQEALEKQIEDAQDKLDKFKDKYKRYDELFSGDLEDTQKALEDLEDQIEDLRIDAFKTSVSAVDNIKDIQEALVEFQQVFSGLQSDDPFRAMATSAAKLKNYFDVATDSVDNYYDTLISRLKEQKEQAASDSMKTFIQSQIDAANDARLNQGNGTMERYGTGYLDMASTNLENMLKEIRQFEETGSSDIFGKNSADLYEVAKDVFDQATSMISDFEGEIDNLRDAILDAIDEIADKMDDRREAYENITEELEHQSDIIQLLHGENSYEEINKVLEAQQMNYQYQISEMEQQLDIWKDMLSAMKEGSDEWKAVQEKITDTQKDLNDLIQTSLENLQKQYENTVNKITQSWSSNAMGNDLDWMETEWELINRNADYYLDATNKAYNIQKLQGQYLDLLDSSNDLHTQQKINEQMKEQLTYLREKTNLSQYDVQYAQAQLEILQKQIALEEAQRNKNQMKLRRDSQGNYSYVYTANQDDVSSAQSDLLDAQNNAYNLSKEQMKQTQADSLSALTDAKSLIDNIWTDANLSMEEKKKRTQTIIDSLKEYLAATSEQLSTSEKNIINDFIGMCEMMTDENKNQLQGTYDEIVNGNIDAFDKIDTRWSTSITDWLQHLDDFNASTDKMFSDLVSGGQKYEEDVKKLGKLIQTDFNDVSDSINKCVEATKKLNDGTSEFITQLKNDAGTVKDYENTLQSYADKISDVTNKMRAYQEQVTELGNKLTAKEQENANLSAQVKSLQDRINGINGSGSGGGGGGGDASNARVGTIIGYRGQYYYDSWGKRPAGHLYAGQARAVVVDGYSSREYGGSSSGTGDFKVHIKSADGKYGDLGWIKPSQMFRTGGYTGDWSDGNPEKDNGKLAWLHQKELVLNASDTENILSVVQMVRDLTKQLKVTSFSSMAEGATGYKMATDTTNIEQSVHITAEFPAANSAAEIESALLSLNDRAVQYAYRA